MPRDRRAVIGTGIWNEPTIRALPYAQQHAYLLAYTQPDLNRCGVLPYRAKRLAGAAIDLTPAHLRRQFAKLHDSGHIVVDEDHEELLVRTYIGHDGLLAQPLVVGAMVRDFQEVTSPAIRISILAELRRLFSQNLPDQDRKGLLLLLGVDPATVEVVGPNARNRDDALARIRAAVGNGLSVPTLTAIQEGHLDPYPEGPLEGLPEGLPDPLTRGRSRMSPTPFPTPSPTPFPRPDGQADQPPQDDPTSELLIEHVRAHTQPLTPSEIGPVRVAITRLVAEGATPDRIRAGLRRMRDKQLGPALLPQMVTEATPTTDRRTSTADARVAQAQAVAQRYRDAETATQRGITR